MATLHKTLSTVEYFTFGFGTMIGVGWLVLMDDWLGRGGPGGAMLGFALGGLLLYPIARTYARLVRQIPDAGAEIAYTEGVLPPFVSFATGWTMVLAYAIVCPWEAVAIGNLLARAFPAMNSLPLYRLGGQTMFAPRLVAGFILIGAIAFVNYRGIRQSGRFQDYTTLALLAAFAVFVTLGFANGDPAHAAPLFPRPGAAGAWLSTLLVLQIVPYFLTGFESVAKGSEEARAGYDPRGFGRAIYLALFSGAAFYVIVVAVVSLIYPWQEIVAGRVGTEIAFERAFGSRTIARVILVGAFFSLLKVFNGNFVAATRMALAIGRRGLVHPSLGRVHPQHGTPMVAVVLVAVLTAAGSLLGDALLVPVTEVGSLAAGVGWLTACLAFLLHARTKTFVITLDVTMAVFGVIVSTAIIFMKVAPLVPGSFTRVEWGALAVWLAIGFAFWIGRPRAKVPRAAVSDH